ncbi:MAG: site-specific integrase [Pseudomonadota bacterium]|nr:site-specific integrase [Pseudomonadota bacterium]
MSNKIQFSATPDLQKQCGMWLESLAVENRLSPHTVASYARDLTQFLDFLADHYARPPALADMSSLQLADLRVSSRAAAQWRAKPLPEPFGFGLAQFCPLPGAPQHAGKSGL